MARLVGLSLSKCLFDLLVGRYNISQVCGIIAGTRITTEEDLVSWFDHYWTAEEWGRNSEVRSNYSYPDGLALLRRLMKITLQQRTLTDIPGNYILPASHREHWIDTDEIGKPRPASPFDWDALGFGNLAASEVALCLARKSLTFQPYRLLLKEIENLLRDDKHITAVKLFRDTFGCGIKDAKLVVDVFMVCTLRNNEEMKQ